MRRIPRRFQRLQREKELQEWEEAARDAGTERAAPAKVAADGISGNEDSSF